MFANCSQQISLFPNIFFKILQKFYLCKKKSSFPFLLSSLENSLLWINLLLPRLVVWMGLPVTTFFAGKSRYFTFIIIFLNQKDSCLLSLSFCTYISVCVIILHKWQHSVVVYTSINTNMSKIDFDDALFNISAYHMSPYAIEYFSELRTIMSKSKTFFIYL